MANIGNTKRSGTSATGGPISTRDNRSPLTHPTHRIAGDRSLGVGAKSTAKGVPKSTKVDKKIS